MSDLILSDQLINQLKAVVVQHDEAADDSIRFAQYLSTISAVVIAEQNASTNQLEQIFSQLIGFSEHVFKQQLNEKAQSSYEQEPIYGVWKPQ